jgi:AraC-like DNA-binding protein/quercetin dioxygenase-like cupin family protein
MSKKRQKAILDRRRRGAAQIVTLSYDYPHRHLVPEHFHDDDQLVYGESGAMQVRTSDGVWTVPTRRAIWVPARVPHAIRMLGRVTMKTLYLAPRLARSLPRDCSVLHVSPLLATLVVHACELGSLDRRSPTEAHLVAVIIDQLEAAAHLPLQLPAPRDPRAQRLVEILLASPGDERSLAELSSHVGASKRTLERVFRSETGMTLGRWRQQLRMHHAMRLIAHGEKITSAALDAGYESPSAFIAMFRQAMGTTPRKYFASQATNNVRP